MDGCSASLAFLHERAEPRRGAGAIAIGTIDFRGIIRDGMGVTGVPSLSLSLSLFPLTLVHPRPARRSAALRAVRVRSRNRPLFAEKTSYNSRSTLTTTRNIMSRHARIVIALLISY